MSISKGTKTIGPANGKIVIRSFKEGILSKMGHDLVIEPTQWSVKVQLDAAEPPAGSAEAEIVLSSLQIVGPSDLSEKDKTEIRGNMGKDVLQWQRFPTARFQSTSVENLKSSGGKGTATVKGQLTLHGQTQPIELRTSFEPSGSGVRVHGEVPLKQSGFGIKPYKAPLGVIKVKDELKVSWDFVVV